MWWNDFFVSTTERLFRHKSVDWQLFLVSPEDIIVIFWHWLQLRKSLLSESFKSLIFFDVLQVHFNVDMWIYFYIFSSRLCTSSLRTYVFFNFRKLLFIMVSDLSFSFILFLPKLLFHNFSSFFKPLTPPLPSSSKTKPSPSSPS